MGARIWLPDADSPYRFAVNMAHGGVIDTIYANSSNLIHNGAGDAFQLATFDPDIILPDDGTGYSQNGIYNPTQAGGGDATLILEASAAGDYIKLQPALFEHHGLADFIWEQRITAVHSPNVWRVDFKSHHTGTHTHNHMHGKYQMFVESGFTRVYLYKGGQWQPNDNPVDNVVRSYLSADCCVLGNPQTGLALGWYKQGLHEWSIWSWWYTTQFGPGPELINWSGDNADSFTFFFGTVEECLQTGAALVNHTSNFPVPIASPTPPVATTPAPATPTGVTPTPPAQSTPVNVTPSPVQAPAAPPDTNPVIAVPGAPVVTPVPVAPVSGTTQPADPHLAGFPRPADDNGRGLHFILDTRMDAVQHYAPFMKQMKIKWATVYGGDELQVTSVAKHLLDNCGTYSVLRVEARAGRLKFPDFWQKLASLAVSMGLPPYIQLYNEPEIEFDNPGQFAAAWGPRAQAIVAGGGYPGLQVMTEEFFAAVAEQMAPEVKNNLFFVLHNYGANHPPSYPYSIGKNAVQDDTCALRFIAIGEWCKQRLGVVPPMLGGEGGWLPGNHDDPDFPAVDYDNWANWTCELFDWFRTGKLSNGEALPDYVFSINPWLLYASNWPSDSWVDGNDPDKKQPLIDRLTQDAPYVRCFQGAGGV